MNISTKNKFIALSVLSAAFMTPSAQACSSEPLVGSVCMVGFTFCPRGFAEANGAILSISQNPTLYSLYGTNFGGDGRTTFALPDLRGRSPMGLGRGPGLSEIRMATKRGNEMTTLDLSTLPSHNHSASFTPTSGGSATAVTIKVSTDKGGNTSPAGGNNVLSASSANGPGKGDIWGSSTTSTVDLAGVTVTGGGGSGGTVLINNNGNGQKFSNTPPQLGMKYCVATRGIYPSRP